MCGRYTLTTKDFTKHYGAEQGTFEFSSYNVAPTQAVPVVLTLEGQRTVTPARWGLIPAWTKDLSHMKANLFNARSETAFEKPSFKGPLRHHRCLVPADGLFEWKREGTTKTPRLRQLISYRVALSLRSKPYSSKRKLLPRTLSRTPSSTPVTRDPARCPRLVQALRLLGSICLKIAIDVVALLVLDGASWHRSPKLTVPDNLRLAFLPPYTPELNPAEHLWPLLREVTANQAFADIDALETRLAERCVWLGDHPGTVASSTSFRSYRPLPMLSLQGNSVLTLWQTRYTL